ncbi:MAG: class I SAM-dependent rRNA methyltransferase [Anaerolineae bacterium]|nr:class I SAM-dependent rRNA methyltransferase [Anaerolineae bacterium]MDW8100802.1 class I SAM-dependent rRNA methyltransferase [Anaerolineae bacterium]
MGGRGEMTAQVRLKPGKERPVLHRHPWIFSGAIQNIDATARDGEVVEVTDATGQWLARGHLNRRSQIVVRLLTWDPTEAVNRSFWCRRLERAFLGRSLLAADAGTNAYRLVHSESDGLPGLIVDRYADWLAVQFSTLGIEGVRETVVELLQEMTSPAGIYERADPTARQREGLPISEGVLAGKEPPDVIEICETGFRFLVDVRHGQKTGFYLDQRENRRIVGSLCQGARVLNAFAYTGAFAVYALAGGAVSVVNIDTSREALELAERNLALNGFSEDRYELLQGDVFKVLRDYRAAGEQFDVVVLDPPKFATTQGQVPSAARGYKDINLLAMQLLRPGGLLATFSCSGVVTLDLFQKIVLGAAVDARRDVQIIGRLSQGPDHPILLSFPESEYLKGLLCRVW